MRALLLGEQPSTAGIRALSTSGGKSLAAHFPLSGAVAQRLSGLAALTPDPDGSRYGRYYWPLREAFDLDNVFYDDRPWVPKEASPQARLRVREHPECCKVVALGKRVGAALGVDCDWFQSTFLDWCGMDAYLLPHPSGRNRLLNDPANLRSMALILRELACRS